MKPETAAAINSMAMVLLSADEMATKEDRVAIIKALAGRAPIRQTISTDEAARILKCCVRSVQNWGRMKILTPIRFGRRRHCWDKLEVEALASQGFGEKNTRPSTGGKRTKSHSNIGLFSPMGAVFNE